MKTHLEISSLMVGMMGSSIPFSISALKNLELLILKCVFSCALAFYSLKPPAWTFAPSLVTKKGCALHGEDVCFIGVTTNDYASNLKSDVGVRCILRCRFVSHASSTHLKKES